MAKGHHGIEFEVVEGWERLPEGWSFTEVAGVATDSRDRVYVFCRGEHPLIVFDKDGKFLDAWGEGMFPRPHGIFIDHLDQVHLVDCWDHTIRTFTTDGTLLRTVGEPGQCSDTGFEPDVSPVQYAGEPFNQVTNVAVLRDGSMYVADGYGNARVHRFDANGKLEFSWGSPGSAPGEFNLPHGIAVDSAGTVYVADRENSRIQLFSPGGEYLRSWDFVNRPDDIFIDEQDNVHVAELGFRTGDPRGTALPAHDDATPRPTNPSRGSGSTTRTAAFNAGSEARRKCFRATSSPPTACGSTREAISMSAK